VGVTSSRTQVEIRPSSRRTKTVSAQWRDGVIVVRVPAHLSATEQKVWADRMVDKLVEQRERAQAASDSRLAARATELSDRYLDGRTRPAEVRWVSNQRKRWGSCTPSTKSIRISDQLRSVPEWVLDAVLLHELVHLLVPNHGKVFQQLLNRYPRVHDSDLFLAGYTLGLDIRAG
jgi:predicted metal-dependent hydrolase